VNRQPTKHELHQKVVQSQGVRLKLWKTADTGLQQPWEKAEELQTTSSSTRHSKAYNESPE
jgi:hypothetical protein